MWFFNDFNVDMVFCWKNKYHYLIKYMYFGLLVFLISSLLKDPSLGSHLPGCLWWNAYRFANFSWWLTFLPLYLCFAGWKSASRAFGPALHFAKFQSALLLKWLSSWGHLPCRGHLEIPGDIFGCHSSEGRGQDGLLTKEHPPPGVTVPGLRTLSSDVSVESLCGFDNNCPLTDSRKW